MNHKPIFIIKGPSALSPLSYSIKFGIRELDTGAVSIAEPVTMRRVKPGEHSGDQSMLELWHEESEEALQSLLDQLWQLGFRPKDIGTAGHLAATQAHLKDMKALVAKSYGVELV